MVVLDEVDGVINSEKDSSISYIIDQYFKQDKS